MFVYFVFVLGIGFALKRYMRTSSDFFLAGRSIPAWVCGLAFISANLGAQEVIGMGASGAKYGIITSHFYWIGAIPAMLFVGLFMMPFYYGSKARSVPEYLRMRFDEKTRALNAFSFALMTVLLLRHLHVRHGSAHPDARPLPRPHARRLDLPRLHRPLGCIIVLGYIFLGGLTSAIYNEVLQFFLIVAGFASPRLDRPPQRRRLAGHQADSPCHHDAFLARHGARQHQLARCRVGRPRHGPRLRPQLRLLVHGLPRHPARHGRRKRDLRPRVPLIAAVPKMFFPFLVILPGLIAVSVTSKAMHPAPTAITSTSAQQQQPLDDAHPKGIIPEKIDPVTGRAVLERHRQPGLQLRPRHPGHAPSLLPHGNARPWPHRAPGQLHVRHGRQRHRIQHRLDLRHLPELHQERRHRRALPLDGKR